MKKKKPFWKTALPESHTHKVLMFVVVVLVLYLLIKAVF